MAGSNYVVQAVEAASNDMSSVQQAADAIASAIRNCTPWLNGQTWTGPAATQWQGDWLSFYSGVQSCLGDLPSAEASVISETRTQAEQFAAKHPHVGF
jgi:uncharacterized protein YukE